jgi:hypothetical protein
MRRTGWLAGAIGALSLLGGSVGVGVAGAGQTGPTTVLELGYDNTGPRMLIYGDFENTKAKCQRTRKIELRVDTGSGYVLRDVDQASRTGTWAVQGPLNFDGARAKAPRKRLPNGDVCRSDSLQLTF